MAVIGMRIQKEQGGIPFENRYFLNVTDLDAAQNLSGDFVLFEKAIHSVQVAFVKMNLWVVGASPRQFRSVPLSGFGTQSAAFPTALEMCLKISFGATNSYPYYKEYRVAVGSDQTDTRNWGVGYLAEVLDAIETADGGDVWLNNRTKTGGELGSPVVQTKVEFSQLNKKWYNRKPQEA